MTTVNVNCENVLKIWEDFESGVYAKDEIFRFEEWNGDVEAFVKNVPMHRRLYAVDVYEGLDSDVRYELGTVPEKRVEGYVVHWGALVYPTATVHGGSRIEIVFTLCHKGYYHRGCLVANKIGYHSENPCDVNVMKQRLEYCHGSSSGDLEASPYFNKDQRNIPSWFWKQVNVPQWLIDDLSAAHARSKERHRIHTSALHRHLTQQSNVIDKIHRAESKSNRLNTIETSINTLRDVTSASIDATHQYVTKSIEPLAQEFKVHQQHTSAYLQQNKYKIQDVEGELRQTAETMRQSVEHLSSVVDAQRQSIEHLVHEQTEQRQTLMRLFWVMLAIIAVVKML